MVGKLFDFQINCTFFSAQPNAAPREDKLKFRAAMKEKALARHERAKAKRNMKMNSTDIRMDLLNIHDPGNQQIGCQHTESFITLGSFEDSSYKLLC